MGPWPAGRLILRGVTAIPKLWFQSVFFQDDDIDEDEDEDIDGDGEDEEEGVEEVRKIYNNLSRFLPYLVQGAAPKSEVS